MDSRVGPERRGVATRARNVYRLSLAVVRETRSVAFKAPHGGANRQNVPAIKLCVGGNSHCVGGNLQCVRDHLHCVRGYSHCVQRRSHRVGEPYMPRGPRHDLRAGVAAAAWVRMRGACGSAPQSVHGVSRWVRRRATLVSRHTWGVAECVTVSADPGDRRAGPGDRRAEPNDWRAASPKTEYATSLVAWQAPRVACVGSRASCGCPDVTCGHEGSG
jgi:hypothetical protein